MKLNNDSMQKARRFSVARFLFVASFCFFTAAFSILLARYVLSFRRNPLVFAAQPPVLTEKVPEETAGKLDINQASADELDMLPGIGPSLAQAIIEYREVNGPFFYLEEIMDVPGIGEKRFTDISPLIDCSPPSQ